jgi:hypothetical protein
LTKYQKRQRNEEIRDNNAQPAGIHQPHQRRAAEERRDARQYANHQYRINRSFVFRVQLGQKGREHAESCQCVDGPGAADKERIPAGHDAGDNREHHQFASPLSLIPIKFVTREGVRQRQIQ